MHRLRILFITMVATFVGLFALAAVASAHITVSAPDATSGGSDQQITFRVPVEEDQDTVGLTVQLPTSTPIASVLIDPIDGWTHTETTSKLADPIKTDDGDITSAVSKITWKASSGQGLKPGEYGEFTIIAGQLPETKSLTFKALQTYADGSVVRWIETAAPGSSEEPEHPAPVLALAAADSGATPSSAAPSAAAGASASEATAPSNTGSIVLSVVALVVAAAALGFAFVSRARRSQS